jgi:predicted PurR-regulated permease PerM
MCLTLLVILFLLWIASVVKKYAPTFFVMVILPIFALFLLDVIGKKLNMSAYQVLLCIILTVVLILVLILMIAFVLLAKKERLIRENKNH